MQISWSLSLHTHPRIQMTRPYTKRAGDIMPSCFAMQAPILTACTATCMEEAAYAQ